MARSGRRKAWGMIGALATLPAGALAQDAVKDSLKDLPAWKIPEICAKDSAKNHCLSLESRAWRAVSGSWVSLPDAVKKLCLGNARTPSDQSWRVLNDCVDEEMEKAGDRRAVSTRFTPGEAVPPPKAVVANVSVPPPILGMPAAPPPFALDAEAEAKRRAEAEAKAKSDADARAAAEAEAKRRADAEAAARAKADADARSAADADAKRRADADTAARTKAEADAKAAADAAARAKAEADARIAEADAKRRADVEAAAKAKADARAAAELKRLADAEAARKAAADAEEAKRREAALVVAKACQDDLQQIAKDGVIRFAFASAALDRASAATLDKLAAAVGKCPGYVVRVEAHTDSVGSIETNKDLSQQRAQSVVEALLTRGFSKELIVAEGFGETKPVGDNATTEGRALNRRIEFAVVPK